MRRSNLRSKTSGVRTTRKYQFRDGKDGQFSFSTDKEPELLDYTITKNPFDKSVRVDVRVREGTLIKRRYGLIHESYGDTVVVTRDDDRKMAFSRHGDNIDAITRFIAGLPLEKGTFEPPPLMGHTRPLHSCTWDLRHDGVRVCIQCGAEALWASSSHNTWLDKPRPQDGLHPADITDPGFYWYLPDPDNREGQAAHERTRPVDWTVVQAIRSLDGRMLFYAAGSTQELDESRMLGTLLPLPKPTSYVAL